MADPSLFQNYMNSRKVKLPAFNFVPGTGFQPTEQSQQVVNLLKQTSGKEFNLQPANSVMAIAGSPMWGTGGGVVWDDNKSTGFVDPLEGNVHVVAHEGGHSVFPSKLREFSKTPSFAQINPLAVPKDSGQRLRYVHETFAKPTIEEEARAQGIAYGVLGKLGLDNNETYATPLDYPRTYLDQGLGLYKKTEIGPPSPQETKEAHAILKGVDPFMQRIFMQGKSLIQ